MAQVSAAEVARALGGGREKSNGPGRGWNTFCPCHNDKSNPSLSVNDGKGGKLLIHCHAGCPSTDVIAALRDRGLWASGGKKWEALPAAPRDAKPYEGIEHPKLGKPSRWWKYTTLDGRIAGYAVRFEEEGGGKTIIPLTWCREDEGGAEKWWWKGFPEPRPIYNLQGLQANSTRHVLVVEGEKTADAAQVLVGDTYAVVSWQGGARALNKTDWNPMKGKDVTLWPDADVPGDEAMRRLAEILLEVGAKVIRRVDITPDMLVEAGVPPEDAVGWDLADDPAKLDVAKMLYNAKPYTPVGNEVVERFNRHFAMAMVGGQAVIIEEANGYDGFPHINYLSVSGFTQFYGNRDVVTGKKQVPESTYWLRHEHRRSYKSVTFKPVSDTPGSYNLWQGFSVDPDPTGSWDMLQTHILENIAQGGESVARWVTGWFAHLVQRPDEKLGTSLALRGKMGTGKTIIGKLMGQLYRPHYVLVDKPHYVVGQFNAHMSACLLLHADEAFFAGNPANVGMLRGLVTSDTIRIEQKGKDSFELKNYLRLLATSNNKWIVPAGFEERRFAVLDLAEHKMQNRAWFMEMLRQMQDGGYAAMLYDLLRFDLSSVDVGKVPSTRALQEQKYHSLDSVTRFWLEKLRAGEVVDGTDFWPDYIILADLHESYVKACVSWGEPRRLDLNTFTREIKEYWPKEWKMRRINSKSSRLGRSSRPWAVETAPLRQHRAKFESEFGGRIDWEEEGVVSAPIPDDAEDLPF